MQNLEIYLGNNKTLLILKYCSILKNFYVEVTFIPKLFFAQLIKNNLGICLYFNKN